MKKLFFVLIAMCCVCTTALADDVTYQKCDNCELIIKHHSNLFGGWTGYGLTMNGAEIVSPEQELLSYNDNLHIVAFRYTEWGGFRIKLFSTDSGKCVYDGWYPGNSSKPNLSYQPNGTYVKAVVNHSPLLDKSGRCVTTTVAASFCRKDGKLYRIKQKQVEVESPVE